MTLRLPLAAAGVTAIVNAIVSGVIFSGTHPNVIDAPIAALNPAVAARAARTQLALAYAEPGEFGEICANGRYKRLAKSAVSIEPMMGDALAAMVLSRRCTSRQAFFAAAQATEPLNRRDLALQVLQLEEQLQQRKPDAVMATMRRMIVIYPELSDRLVPLLARVIVDDASLNKVVQLVKQQSDWKSSFLRYAAETFKPDRVLWVRRAYGGFDRDLTEIDNDAVAALAKRGDLAAAWSYFQIAAPGTAAKRDTHLLGAAAMYQPFGWSLSSSDQLQVRPGESTESLLVATLHLRAAGTLASQVYPAKDGVYVVTIDVGPESDVVVKVQTRCLEPLGTGTWINLRNGESFNPSKLGGGCRFASIQVSAINGSDRRRRVAVHTIALTKESSDRGPSGGTAQPGIAYRAPCPKRTTRTDLSRISMSNQCEKFLM